MVLSTSKTCKWDTYVRERGGNVGGRGRGEGERRGTSCEGLHFFLVLQMWSALPLRVNSDSSLYLWAWCILSCA